MFAFAAKAEVNIESVQLESVVSLCRNTLSICVESAPMANRSPHNRFGVSVANFRLAIAVE